MNYMRGSAAGRRSLVLGMGYAASAACAQVPDTVSAFEQCVLRSFASAEAQTTVAQLRERCGNAQVVSPRVAETVVTSPSARERLRNAPELVLPAAPELQGMLSKPPAQRSIVERRAVSEIQASAEEFALLPHRPNYLLPLTVHSRPKAAPATSLLNLADARQSAEAQFQTSFKFPLTEPLFGGLALPFFAYTGRAWWQVYDADRSRPFREYNHEPELFVAMPPTRFELGGWKHRLSTVGFSHQSNGRTAPTSRSWNRLFAEAYVDNGPHYWASLKLWYRLPEPAKAQPNDQVGDDNPDITRFLGRGELKAGYISDGGHNFSITARQALRRDGKGAIQFDWSRPTRYSPSARWYIQGFAGYGDSLIDYDQRVNRLGLGIMLNDWF